MSETDENIVRRAEAAVGKVLREKWHLDKLLGVGGMAAVYRATHRNGSRAAIKVLHPEAALAPTVKDRFLHEGYLANKVEHRGAVSILDDDVDVDGTVYLVMELLSGETLEGRLDRISGKVSPEELLQIIDQVLDCLHAAHEKGIVHRDLKPGNLFITEQGQIKILDFGIARLTGTRRPGKTTGAQALGTPGFMPPEQARGHWDRVDAQSDLWAVGAVMFAALTGRYVHEAPTVNEQLLSAMTEPAPPIRDLVPNLAEPVADLIDRALQFEKSDRWLNAMAMRAAVANAYRELTGKPLDQAPRLSARPPRPPSIDPDAATLDAEALPSGFLEGTTARPVAGTGRETRLSRAKIGVLAVGALVLLGGGLFAMTSGGEKETTEPASASQLVGVSDESQLPLRADPRLPSPTLGLDPAVAEKEIGVDAGPDASDETAKKPPVRTKRRYRPSPKPKPKAKEPEKEGRSILDIDIFSRRK